MLGSHDPRREFLIRSCGILIHEQSVLVQEAVDEGGGPVYALPGGHLEFGESLAACMSREFYEESGLNVEAEKLVYEHENFYTIKGITTHEIGFYFVVDLNSEFPAADSAGYILSREPHIRLRLLPLAGLFGVKLMPPFLRDELPRDVRDHFARPTRHLISREE
ncbi:MAG: NUDIX domain-containing protein [Methanobacteriota archaeon]|nr:MAG: NUDIX domain-containing protein [Euryarchaeota archaeon]